MRYNRSFRILALAITLSLLVMVISAMPALAQSISVYPSYGPVGTTVSISGTGLTPSISARIYFPDNSTFIKNYPTNTSGNFYTTFTVDELPAGYQTVWVHDTVAWYSTSFVVEPEINLNKSSGYVGDKVTISGTGFAANKQVTITFHDVNVGTATTNSLGSFSGATFTVPASYNGTHTVKAKDASNNYDTISFSTKNSISISPTSGVVGDEVAVSGTGFRASRSVTVTFDDVSVATSTTDANGSFGVSFIVPGSVKGTHEIEASDATYRASADFDVLIVAALSTTSGYVGNEVTVSGTGFAANRTITITLAGVQVGTTTTDAKGSFSGSFLVPSHASGTYNVKISDGVNIKETEFTILISASLSPATSQSSPGHVGIELTVSGIGFEPNGTVIIKYGGVQLATATADDAGVFSVIFNAPYSTGGSHTITASDGTNTRQFTFVMESKAPPIPPLLLPEMDTKAKSEAYLDWDDVNDPSGVTYTLQIASDADFEDMVLEKIGLIDSEYTITKEEKLESVSKKEPYYWHVKAIDGASNESDWSAAGSFYVGFIFNMPQWVIYLLFSLGMLLFGYIGFIIGRRTAYY